MHDKQLASAQIEQFRLFLHPFVHDVLHIRHREDDELWYESLLQLEMQVPDGKQRRHPVQVERAKD